MTLEEIFPGICVTLLEHLWTPEQIRAHGFTHIIHIDRHLAVSNPNNQHIDANANLVRSTAVDYDDLCAGFRTLDLHFVEKNAATTVAPVARLLPNCYKAVAFIETALFGGGSVLIIDRLDVQKSLTMVIGFLMYKDHIKFRTAFRMVQDRLHSNFVLDEFYQSQLHEYEPILQMQRAQSYGNSCSRELRCSRTKRKLSTTMFEYDDDGSQSPTPTPTSPSPSTSLSSTTPDLLNFAVASSLVSSLSSFSSTSSSTSSSSATSSASLSPSYNSYASSMSFMPTYNDDCTDDDADNVAEMQPTVRDGTCPADIMME